MHEQRTFPYTSGIAIQVGTPPKSHTKVSGVLLQNSKVENEVKICWMGRGLTFLHGTPSAGPPNITLLEGHQDDEGEHLGHEAEKKFEYQGLYYI